jgi:hypothetical protein
MKGHSIQKGRFYIKYFLIWNDLNDLKGLVADHAKGAGSEGSKIMHRQYKDYIKVLNLLMKMFLRATLEDQRAQIFRMEEIIEESLSLEEKKKSL